MRERTVEDRAKPIAHRLLLFVVAFTLTITFIMTGIQTAISYRNAVGNIKEDISTIESAYLPSITDRLWVMDKEHLQVMLNGILHIPYIEYVELVSKNRIIVSAGRLKSKRTIHREFSLNYVYNGKKMDLGTLRVTAGLEKVYKDSFSKMLILLVYQGAQIFLVSFFILFVVQSMITRHLRKMADHVSGMKPGTLTSALVLEDRTASGAAGDELDRVAAAINAMDGQLYEYIRRQNSVSKLSQHALKGEDLPSLMDEVVKVVSETLQVEYSEVLEVVPETGTMLLKAGVGWKEGLVGQVTIPASEDLQEGYTLSLNVPVIVEDFKDEKRFGASEFLREHDVASGISVIITGRERPFGILCAHARARRGFTEYDIRFIESVANLLAAAIERKRMEELIVRSKQDWEDTFFAITDMITIHDKDFNIIRANKAADKILGLPFLEVTGAKCYEYYHGTECPPAGCPSCQSLKTGRPQNSDFFEPKLGRFLDVTAIPRFDSNNQLAGLIHVVRDITERKQAEESIRRQIQRLSALRSVDMAISSSLDLHITLNVFIEQVKGQLYVDAADVLLLNPHTKILEYAAGQGFRTTALKQSSLRLGEGLAGTAALENRLVNIPDLRANESGFKRLGLIEGEDFVTYYGVPLVAKGRVQGVLEIFHRSRIEPDEEWLDFLNSLALQAAIAIDNNSLFYGLERSNAELAIAYDSTIEGWSRALDYRDKETEGHSQRVTEMTLTIAREMGMTDQELVHVRRGALLHDIGKMGIPDSILLKPGPLDEEEWKVMRLHPIYAYELLYPISYLRPALDIPYCHHERWDGSGYPRGLRGEQIPFSARIFAVVDVWDALRSDRPYRPSQDVEKIKDYLISASGTHLDPKVVEVFLKIEL